MIKSKEFDSTNTTKLSPSGAGGIKAKTSLYSQKMIYEKPVEIHISFHYNFPFFNN